MVEVAAAPHHGAFAVLEQAVAAAEQTFGRQGSNQLPLSMQPPPATLKALVQQGPSLLLLTASTTSEALALAEFSPRFVSFVLCLITGPF